MIKRIYEHPNYNIIGIKNDKYKNCIIEVIFRKNIQEHDLIERSFLADTLCFSSKNYSSKKDMLIKEEELYDLNVNSMVTKMGNSLETSFNVSFVCPKYIKEEEYLEEIVKFLFDLIFKPNVVNDAFELKNFHVVKKQILTDIKNIRDNPHKVAISKALKSAFKDSSTSYQMLGEEEYLQDIDSDKLYEIYLSMINNDLCDIFVIGDLNLDKVNDLISKYYTNRIIKTSKCPLYVNNKQRNKINYIEEEGKFVQSNLIMIYNISNSNKKDLQITPYIFNNIFGNGSLNSKLLKYLREDNSLCYGVDCLYLRFDGILIVKVSLAYENIKKAISLIKKAIKEMIKGIFLDEELEDAKKSAIFSIKSVEEYIGGILNNYIFNYYDDFPIPEERIKIVKEITRNDIINFAKSLKLNTIHILKEQENERN